MKHSKPLPLSDCLRDLAILRATQLENFDSLLSQFTKAEPESGTLDRSYEFGKEARAALKIHNGGTLEDQGRKVDAVRASLDDVLQTIQSA